MSINERKTILAVDDEAINQDIIREMLAEDYDLLCAENGETCLEHLSYKKPDLILLDVNMPGMNGLDVCKQIRDNPQSNDIPVIFVSALAHPEERIKGYEAGANDYISKPFVEKELIRKISLLLEHQDEKKILKKDFDETMDALLTSVDDSGEQGIVLNTLKESFSCKTIADLVELAFNAIKQFNLAGSIMISSPNEADYFFSDKNSRPIEKKVLYYLKDTEHVFSFSRRAIFNSSNISLLIRNMPEDEFKTGRYRDHLAMLVDGLNARIHGIKNEQGMVERTQLANVIQLTQEKLKSIDEQHQAHRIKHSQLISQMIQNIEQSFTYLGLSEKQEQELLNFIYDTEEETDNLYKEALQTDSEFNQIINKLKQAET